MFWAMSLQPTALFCRVSITVRKGLSLRSECPRRRQAFSKEQERIRQRKSKKDKATRYEEEGGRIKYRE